MDLALIFWFASFDLSSKILAWLSIDPQIFSITKSFKSSIGANSSTYSLNAFTVAAKTITSQQGSSMNTRYSKLLLAFLFLILVVQQVVGERPENGPYVEYYGNGQKELEGHYKNGKREGLWTTWWENGRKANESHYKNGELVGSRTSWFETGKKWVEVYWKDGKLLSASSWKPDGESCPITKMVNGSGIIVVWDENGQKEEEGHYKDGEKDGFWKWWHDNGQKSSEGHYTNGELDGLMTIWCENGQKRWEGHSHKSRVGIA